MFGKSLFPGVYAQFIMVVTVVSVMFPGCSEETSLVVPDTGSPPAEITPLSDIDISSSENGIVPLPGTVDPSYSVFSKYTMVPAANGRPIHILIQSGVTDDQVIFARKVLKNHLTDVPGSVYGSDKSAISNKIAANNAILSLFRDTAAFERELRRAGGFFDNDVKTQDLRGDEIFPEGTPEYMDQDNPVRDASYEEILHFVQGFGIVEAAPQLQADLEAATANALALGTYHPPGGVAGNFVVTVFEYFAFSMETYFGLWQHIRPNQEYVYGDRESMQLHDPDQAAIIEGFLGSYWQYTAELPPGFAGTFSLIHDDNLTYTNKSQYLKNVSLRGSSDANLVGNDQDNVLTGNSGDNVLTPGQGNDTLDGAGGDDTAVFSGIAGDYVIAVDGDMVTVTDSVPGRDGENILSHIEFLKFTDTTLTTADL